MSRWTDKADAYVAAYGLAPSFHHVCLALAVAEHETLCGDAWPGEHNWGATTVRGLNSDERAKLSAAGVYASASPASEAHARAILGSPPGLALHRDYAASIGWYFTWFARYPDDVGGARYFQHLLLRGDVPAVMADENAGPRELAAAMYKIHYFLGVHPHDGGAGDAANVNDYASALARLVGPIGEALRDWTIPGAGADPTLVEPLMPDPST